MEKIASMSIHSRGWPRDRHKTKHAHNYFSMIIKEIHVLVATRRAMVQDCAVRRICVSSSFRHSIKYNRVDTSHYVYNRTEIRANVFTHANRRVCAALRL